MENKYYTQNEAAELLNVSVSSLKTYIKLLKKEEKIGKFNKNNQPNFNGIKELQKIAEEQNPHIKKYQEYEDKIKELKKEIEKLKKEKEDITNKYIEYTEETNKKFTKLQEQSNIIIANLTQANNFIKQLQSNKKENIFTRIIKAIKG